MKDEEHPLQTLLSTDHEPSLEDALFLSSRRPSAKDIFLSVGGGMLVHVLALLMMLVLAFLNRPGEFQVSSIRVNLISPEEIGGGPGATDDPAGGKQPETVQTSSSCGISHAHSETIPYTGAEPPASEEPPAPEKATGEPVVEQIPQMPERVAQIEPKEPRERKAKKPASPTPKQSSKPTPKPNRTAGNESAHSVQAPSPTTSQFPQEPDALNGSAGPDSGDGIGSGGSRAEGAGKGSGLASSGESSLGLAAHPAEFKLGEVDQPPQVVKRVEPIYPYMARCQKISGKVVVKFLVKTDGSVSKAYILEANPKGVFDQSALEAVRQWRFNAGCYRGKTVPTWIILPVQFKLSG